MTHAVERSAPSGVEELLARRTAANERFFAAEADRIARLCHQMAERFARGGRLIALGISATARSDVRHVAVEFVHPVIVGKRALPAIGLTLEGGPLVLQTELAAEPGDIAIAFGGEREIVEALALARARDCLTIAFAHVGAEWEFEPPSDDPFVRQELVETLYHVLWELVHVFFEHQGLLEGRAAEPVHDGGAASFLYPFLGQEETGLESVLGDVAASVTMKAAGGRRAARADARPSSRASWSPPRRRCARGSRAAAGCSRSATADRRPTRWTWSPTCARQGGPPPALDLTEDSAILTAIANDVGPRPAVRAADHRPTGAPATSCSPSPRAVAPAT